MSEHQANKLWSKDKSPTSALVESFTVGRDKEFDLSLARYDVQGSLAHIQMLESVGLLSTSELTLLQKELNIILKAIEENKFSMDPQAEDIHSQIETMLVDRIGETGKKIHSGRSRNDQVAVDIKLYLRAEMIEIKKAVQNMFDLLISKSEQFKDKLLPGYTHFQIAMPSSFGLWFGAYAESLVDDLDLMATAWHLTNKNPLGSGAGYGSSLPLNRKMTTALLGFQSMHYNSVYAQMSRGKTEKWVAMALSSVAATLSKMAMDCCLYMSQNFGFISFPDELTTGSSIMPHKKNPDVFELIRAKCNRIAAIPNELSLLLGNLPSGYHRDLQLTKEILFPAIATLKDCLEMSGLMLSNIQVKDDILDDQKYAHLFSVEAVNVLVNEGIPFREAYRQVGQQIETGQWVFDSKNQLPHTHEGSIGQLNNEDIQLEMTRTLAKFL